ncbi:MAG TPA: GAF domain-containing protein [Burkholderiales bacterium]|jgi:GAF domain-containing protein|nr:GAF domain-containing protein [Burkholderiales bacterium]
MISTAELVASYESLLADLRAKTNATRAALRLEDAEHGFQIEDVVAESIAPGTEANVAETSLQQRNSLTAEYLRQHRQLLVHNDCLNATLQFPEELRRIYGTKAQMIAPIVRADKMVGWISVHQNESARQWKPEDVVALEAAVDAAQNSMDTAAATGPASSPAVKTDGTPEAPVDSARLHATKKVPEPDSLGG